MIHLGQHGTYATIPEAATHYNVQPVTIYAWTYRRNIRTTYSQRQLHVNLDDIDAYRWTRGRRTVESDLA